MLKYISSLFTVQKRPVKKQPVMITNAYFYFKDIYGVDGKLRVRSWLDEVYNKDVLVAYMFRYAAECLFKDDMPCELRLISKEEYDKLGF